MTFFRMRANSAPNGKLHRLYYIYIDIVKFFIYIYIVKSISLNVNKSSNVEKSQASFYSVGKVSDSSL